MLPTDEPTIKTEGDAAPPPPPPAPEVSAAADGNVSLCALPPSLGNGKRKRNKHSLLLFPLPSFPLLLLPPLFLRRRAGGRAGSSIFTYFLPWGRCPHAASLVRERKGKEEKEKNKVLRRFNNFAVANWRRREGPSPYIFGRLARCPPCSWHWQHQACLSNRYLCVYR